MAVEGRSNVVLNMHAQLQISLLMRFLAYCTRPVSVHLAMACGSCLFNSFSVFLLSLKQQQNLMKILFSCIHFPIWPDPPKLMKKNVFYTGKLYGLTGMMLLLFLLFFGGFVYCFDVVISGFCCFVLCVCMCACVRVCVCVCVHAEGEREGERELCNAN